MESIADSLIFKRIENIAKNLIDWDNHKRCNHFSFILLKKRIVSIGTNIKKTHPIHLKNRKISIHTGEDFSEQKHTCSEFNAIVKFKRLTNIDTKKCVLINLRYDRNKKLAFAFPCMSCKSLLNQFQFKNIIYTDVNGTYKTYK